MARPLAYPLLALAAAGCASTIAAPREGAPAADAVVRGQGPSAIDSAPWGPSYLAPGELSCDTPPPPFGLGYEEASAPLAVPPGAMVVPGAIAAPAPSVAAPAPRDEPGWFDVLPPDGGPISDDFGLPSQPRIDGRVANPLYVRATNPDAAWEEVAREASRYFPIASEERVTQTGAMLTEGRLVTHWASGSTIFEPWRRDSASSFDRWQSTLQPIRRRALFRVTPAAGGYEVGVRVEKQLEDLRSPERATAGAASLRNDSSLPTDRVTPIDPVRQSDGWIDIGRDEALEQRILKRLQSRFGTA